MTRLRQQPDTTIYNSANEPFESEFFINLVLVLDNPFPQRSRSIEKDDGLKTARHP